MIKPEWVDNYAIIIYSKILKEIFLKYIKYISFSIPYLWISVLDGKSLWVGLLNYLGLMNGLNIFIISFEMLWGRQDSPEAYISHVLVDVHGL